MTTTAGPRRRRLLAALSAAFVGCLVLAFGPAVVADDEPSPLTIRRVDATDPDAVAIDVIWNGQRDAVTDATVREDGRERPHETPEPLSAKGVEPALVVVVDTSRSMAGNGGVRRTQETLRAMIDDLEGDEAMAIVSFGSNVRVHSDLTSERDQLLDAVDELVAPDTAKTSMWDGVLKGASLFSAAPDLQPNMILITDGYDDSSQAGLGRAAAAVAEEGAAVFALAYDAQEQVDIESLNQLVERAGGAVISATTEEDLDDGLIEVQASLDRQYRIVYESAGHQGRVDLEVTIANATATSSFTAGAVSAGNADLDPVPTSRSWIPSFVRGDAGLIAAVSIGALAVVLAVVAGIMIATREDASLDRMLQVYTEGGQAETDAPEGLAQTALMQRAVELTEEIATERGVLVKVEQKLEQADLPLRAAEALFFYAFGAVVVTVLGAVLGGLMGLLVAGFVGFLVPLALLNFLGARRKKQFEAQLPDMLQLLAGSLRAGYSLVQGVDAVANEVDGPMARELRRVMTEARLGRELEDALESSAARVGSKDFEWAIMAVRIQREVGGNLAELLLTVASTMVDRERLRRDVATLTAEGKISAFILGLLPPGLGVVMYVMNPEYMGVLFTETLGKILLGVGCTSALIGFAWMKKCITIEV